MCLQKYSLDINQTYLVGKASKHIYFIINHDVTESQNNVAHIKYPSSWIPHLGLQFFFLNKPEQLQNWVKKNQQKFKDTGNVQSDNKRNLSLKTPKFGYNFFFENTAAIETSSPSRAPKITATLGPKSKPSRICLEMVHF